MNDGPRDPRRGTFLPHPGGLPRWFAGSGLARSASRAALLAIGVLAVLALLAGAVRILPLVTDPNLPWRVAEPFARSLVWLALEVALFVGWILGWGLAGAASVDRGEARVFALLGRTPLEVSRALVPQAVIFSLVLGLASWLAARDAREPGRVLGAILESGHKDCAAVEVPRVMTVPFLGGQWLCAPSEAPRIFLRPPRPAPQGVALTAASVRVSADVREVTFGDVHMTMGAGALALAAGEVRLARLPPLVASASLRPWARAFAVVAGAVGTGFGLIWLILRLRVRRRIAAAAIGGMAAASAFGVLRAIDRAGEKEVLLPLVLAAGALGLALGGVGLVCLRRLKRG